MHIVKELRTLNTFFKNKLLLAPKTPQQNGVVEMKNWVI